MKAILKTIPAMVGLLTVLFVCLSPPAQAGWTGSMNGLGFGMAAVNVTAEDNSKTLTSPNTNGPSVSMTHNTNFFFGTSLPSGASRSTVAQVKGFAGYIWQAFTLGNNGDDTGNPDLDHIKVDASEFCASLLFTSSLAVSNAKSGTIEINAIGEAGTAFRARGFELVNGGVPPTDNPTTPEDEFKEFLKLYGELKWDIAMAGPFAAGPCSTLTIPFSIKSDFTNLYFVADGTAKSVRIINCPQDIIVQCGQPVVYPDLDDLEAIDDVTLTYDPPLPPGGMGVTPVTVTATHASGCKAICEFNVINALDFNGFYPPINTFDDGTCQAPVRTVKLGNNLPVKFDVSCNGSPVTTGTPPHMSIEKPSVAGNCDSPLQTVIDGDFQLVGSEWHFNWDTGSGGVQPGPHKLTVTLQDSVQHYVWVKIK